MVNSDLIDYHMSSGGTQREKPSRDPGKKLFEISIFADTIALLLFSGLFFLVGLSNLLQSSVLVEPGAFTLTCAFIALALFLLANHGHKVRKATVYENLMTVRGKGLRREIDYGMVESAVLVKSSAYYFFGPRLRIKLKGEQTPLLLYRNPKSRLANADLCSWLLQKTKSAAPV